MQSSLHVGQIHQFVFKKSNTQLSVLYTDIKHLGIVSTLKKNTLFPLCQPLVFCNCTHLFNSSSHGKCKIDIIAIIPGLVVPVISMLMDTLHVLLVRQAILDETVEGKCTVTDKCIVCCHCHH